MSWIKEINTKVVFAAPAGYDATKVSATMPELVHLPPNAHVLFEDLSRLAMADDRPVVAAGVRPDGSLILANRHGFGRVISWMRTALAGRKDEASIQVNLLLARQLVAARGGMHAIAATDRVGVESLPLRNRDLQVVRQVLQRHAPHDPAAALELRDGYQANAQFTAFSAGSASADAASGPSNA